MNFLSKMVSNKGGDSLPLLFNIAVEYAASKFQENNEGLELNGTHPLLDSAADVNLLDQDINTIKT
jgi:hypothetical protein